MRFYACFVAVCFVVSICSGQQQCCLNHDIYTLSSEMVIGEHRGQHLATYELSVTSVMDYISSRFYFNVTTIEAGNISYYLYIEDLSQNYSWTIFPETQLCEANPLPQGSKPIPKCIAGNAQYIDQFNNSGDVLVNRWQYEYEYQSDGQNGEGPRDFTVNGCIQTGGSFVGTWDYGEEFDVLYGFSNYNFKVLTDASEYFNMPSYCNSTFNVG